MADSPVLPPMRIALTRSACFALTAFVLIALWEALTFELPREPQSEVWKQRLLVHIFLIIVVALGSVVGALLGFSYFPANRTLTLWRLATLGAIFAVVMFFVLAPLVLARSFVAVFIGSLLLSAILVQIGGRALARSAA
jgi:hypothetical protein